MQYNINKILSFIKQNNNVLFNSYSNNKLRSYIVSKLKRKHLYIDQNSNNNIVGIIEYYRYSNIDELIQACNSNTFVGSKGTLLYISLLSYAKSELTKTRFKKFVQYLNKKEHIKRCWILKYKKNSFYHKEIKIIY